MKQLTNKEIEVLNHLLSAHQAFCELEPQHPDEAKEWAFYLHGLQGLIGFRSAQRTNPEVFPIKQDLQKSTE